MIIFEYNPQKKQKLRNKLHKLIFFHMQGDTQKQQKNNTRKEQKVGGGLHIYPLHQKFLFCCPSHLHTFANQTSFTDMPTLYKRIVEN